MYTSLLGAFLLGLVPLQALPPSATRALSSLSIAPPAMTLELSQPLSASGVLIMDAQTGQPIFAQHRTTRRPMASLTKLMTALLIVENHDLNEWVEIPESAQKFSGNGVWLKVGEEFTVGDLLSALLIPSANDAAEALAIHHSGSRSAFVEEMNARAEELGLKDTHYTNPIGMDDSEQWSTPQDIAWLTSYVFEQPEIRKRMSLPSTVITSRNGQSLSLAHSHTLLHQKNSIEAGKTGTTPMARECLVSVVKSHGREYIVVILRSLARYRDMQTIVKELDTHTENFVSSGSILEAHTSAL